MKEKRLLKVMGEIDEKYVEEAAPAAKKAGEEKGKLVFIRWGVTAACLFLLCVSVIAVSGRFRSELLPDNGWNDIPGVEQTALPDMGQTVTADRDQMTDGDYAANGDQMTDSGQAGQTKSEVITIQNSADYPFYATAQELVEAADLIFSGFVESVTYEVLDVRTESGTDSLTGLSEAQGTLYTLYEIKVSEVYKGTFEENTLTVKCPGGEVDGSLHISGGTPSISQGGTYLFLTATYENTYPSLLNADQACYDMNVPENVNEEDNGAITLSQILEVLGR